MRDETQCQPCGFVTEAGQSSKWQVINRLREIEVVNQGYGESKAPEYTNGRICILIKERMKSGMRCDRLEHQGCDQEPKDRDAC